MKNRYVKNLLKIGVPVLLIGGLIVVKLMDSPAGESKKDIKKGTQIPGQCIYCEAVQVEFRYSGCRNIVAE